MAHSHGVELEPVRTADPATAATAAAMDDPAAAILATHSNSRIEENDIYSKQWVLEAMVRAGDTSGPTDPRDLRIVQRKSDEILSWSNCLLLLKEILV